MSSKEEVDTASLDQRIKDIEAHIASARGVAGEDTGIMVTLSSTLAQLYQARAQAHLANSADEIVTFLGGVVALLDGPVGQRLLAMAGADEEDSDIDQEEDDDSDEDEDDDDDSEDGDDDT